MNAQISTLPPVPRLLFPREEAVLNGADVTFSWEPLPDVDTYCLEVSADPDFTTCLLRQAVTDATSVRVTDTFPTDGTTLYWRVIVEKEARRWGNDTIESFIAGTAADADRHVVRPDHYERLGPLAELMTGGGDDVMYLHSRDPHPHAPAIGEDFGDVEAFYEHEDAVGVAHENVEFRQVLKVVFTIFGVLAIMIAVVFARVNVKMHTAQLQKVDATNYVELRTVEAAAAAKLDHYAVLDADQQIYQIPIERAMERIVAQARAEDVDAHRTSKTQAVIR